MSRLDTAQVLNRQANRTKFIVVCKLIAVKNFELNVFCVLILTNGISRQQIENSCGVPF